MPEQAWELIHIDHAGPVEGQILIIFVDATTKWLEVAQILSTFASVTVMVLCSLFSCFSILKIVVSYNGPGFKSEEFANFFISQWHC